MYNSDGYVMIDMSDVDLTKSSQNIPGIYKRVLEVIDTNKLALIVNAGNNTPMTAVVHKKLNYYKITTLLYIFTINTNDIVIVEESGEATVDVEIVPTLTEGTKIADFSIGSIEGELFAPTQQSEINDNVTAVNSTWSSTKISNELSGKANTSAVYTKAEVDTALSGKADTSDIPTKTSELTNDSGFITSAQVPTIDDNTVASDKVWSSYKTSAELGNKANSSDVYTKTEVDTALSGKADTSDVYTKTQVDTALAAKQDTLSNTNMTVSFNIPISGGGIGAVRYGNIVIVSMVLKAQNAVNANTQIATLANATIVSDSYVTCYGSQGAHARLKMSGNGNIQTESALNNNDYYSATFVAIIS